jgi:Kef-type K+ transport system membrane component KefB
MDSRELLVALALIWLVAKVAGEGMERVGQTAVLGEPAIAIVSKLAAGLAVYQRGVRRWPVGVGMIPRGEVGLIFAGIGLSKGVIADSLYSALVIVVMLTTLATPPWLKALYSGAASPARRE